MSPQEIRECLNQSPFLPLTVILKDGQRVRVTLPDQISLFGPEGRWVVLDAKENVLPERIEATSVESLVRDEAPADYKVNGLKYGREMTIEKFDEFLRRQPFVPFTIHTADGERFLVKSPEFASRTVNGRTIFVSTEGERTEWIDLLLVVRLSAGVELEALQSKQRRGK